MPYTLVRGQSVRSSFRSGQQSGQTLVKLGQPWSNLVNSSQTWSTLVKLRGICPGPPSWGYSDVVGTRRVRLARLGLPRFTC
jgi:hypothetical protein